MKDDYGRSMHLVKEKCSVVQLGSQSHIVVAHIARFPTSGDKPDQLAPDVLRFILGSPDIIKTGLEVLQDGNLCETQLAVKVHGLRCLRIMHNSLSKKKFGGMGGLAALYLGKRLRGKGDTERQLSDWSLPHPLTEPQIEYAANDALISLLIHNEIASQISTSPHHSLLASLQPTLSSSSPNLHINPPTTPSPALLKQKAKTARERKHRQNFDSLDTDSKILYGKLRELRDKIMREAGWFDATQSRFVADTDTIFLLARERPVTVGELEGLGKKVQKATREVYWREFLGVVRGHLGLENVGDLGDLGSEGMFLGKG
ncbi:hypothetical protein FKW77_010461 [Venturia effusa]|uniref:3'-5' exonuclease domain-containing protein n=1 Tax=Venturia effusa TaxID=50376 RepID=A0A517L2E6_9PEZI|nr:hypothetical protein FKW77_010461 [Venturia effusa]